MLRWFLVIVMFIHGLIHLMGGVSQFGLAEIEGLSGQTLFTLSSNLSAIYGGLWFITVIIFILAALSLIIQKQWWQTFASIGVLISQVLIIIWWTEAKWGLLPNILIAIGSYLYLNREQKSFQV